MDQKYYPLGNYIKLCKERNKDLSAKLHWGLSSTEGLIPLPLEKGERSKKSFWVIEQGQFACDLTNFGKSKSLAYGIYKQLEKGILQSRAYNVFEISTTTLKNEYLSLILNSKWANKKLLNYACHGCASTLPWSDFCNLKIRVPDLKEQEDLIRKYKACERLIELKKEINNHLERWMISLYHLTFDNLDESEYERKVLQDVFAIQGGATPGGKFKKGYFCKEGGFPWVEIKDLTTRKGKFISRGENNITQAGLDSCSTNLISKGSILFSCWGSVGKMAINQNELCLSRTVWGIECKPDEKNYFWFLLKGERRNIKNLAHGTTMSGISQKDLKRYIVDLPPKELIHQFNQTCEPFFVLQKKNEQEIRELQKLQRYFIELTN